MKKAAHVRGLLEEDTWNVGGSMLAWSGAREARDR